MRKVLVVLAALAVLPVLLVQPAVAASSTFGNACSINSNTTNTETVVMTGRSGANPLQVAAPVAGVITKVAISVGGPGPFPSTVKSVRPNGGTSYTVIAESASISITSAVSTYNVRVPVAAGDLLGLAGTPQTLLCSTPNAGDTVVIADGDLRPGATVNLGPSTNTALPLVATIEPDGDHDGYGDDTQDACPQSAAAHTACPVVTLDSFAAGARKAITLAVVTNLQAQVAVTGTVRVNHHSLQLTGGTAGVSPGQLGLFKVRLPGALKAALASLPANKSIKVTLTATAPNIVGGPSTHQTRVRLFGTKG
jgi:hypothetical protein